MKRFAWMAALGLMGIVLASCNGGSGENGGGGNTAEQHDFSSKTGDDIGTKLASVDGMEVGTEDFDRVARRMRPRAGEVTDEFKQEVMDELVNETLLYQEALRQGIDKDPKIRKMMVNTLLKRDVYGTLDPEEITDEELRAYFEEHKEDFVVPEKVQIKRILIKAGNDKDAARIKANEVQQDVSDDPAQFKSLAQEHSQGPYARRGGDLGFVGKKGKPGVDQAVIDAAFALEKGEVSEVIETEDGFHIIYVPNKRERVERTFEQMKGSVLRKVKSDRYNDLHDTYVQRLKDGANVELDETALAGYDYQFEQRGAPGAGPVRLTPPTGGGELGIKEGADAVKVAPSETR